MFPVFGQDTQIIPENQQKVAEYQTYQLTERQNPVLDQESLNGTHLEGDQTIQIYRYLWQLLTEGSSLRISYPVWVGVIE